MKILVLGGNGMAGHMIVQFLKKNTDYDIKYTSRIKDDINGYYLEVKELASVENLIETLKPDILINCIGVLNDKAEQNKMDAFLINGIFPHQLASLMERNDGKLIHLSTDCVFSGDKGNYKEYDLPDPVSVYGKTKALGEIKDDDRHLTIRTSIIGPELKESGIGLFQWFMKQKGNIHGYKKVFWNGVTTLELAKAIKEMVKQDISGLYHLCGKNKISKHDLLKLIQRIFQKKDVKILPDKVIQLDRSLVNTRSDFHYSVPPYEQMIQELKDWMDDS